ncbi:phosphonate C-P lyase system protein PhnG [Pelagibius marinus]|uniref:phosphonate C-P lyase system protein PhnG n=1 Tax=Pelagibius marinus TaxID=2762760 RepID=UPI0018730C1F|nr:phosphonate C-P lyase system protein PhnG [Pelagibius marinus]
MDAAPRSAAPQGDGQSAPGERDPAQAARRRWMSVLAKAKLNELESAWEDLAQKPAYDWLRRPEVGMVMVRARTGGTGGRFNLGQMTVTRCALRLASGEAGLGYVQGRSKRHAELAALFDALLQDEGRRGELEDSVIAPLEASHLDRRTARSRKANSTKVNFFTMVRGENE